jgi:hypothetical protein
MANWPIVCTHLWDVIVSLASFFVVFPSDYFQRGTLDKSSITCYNYIDGNIMADKSLPVKIILMVTTSQSGKQLTKAESETQC